MEIKFKSIGKVKTRVTAEEVRKGGTDLEGELEIDPEFEPALEGIESFSHLFLLCYFHKLRPEQVGPLKVKPKHLVRRGFKLENLPALGVFALDSPTRPNPIGLTLVRLINRDGRTLHVRGLDVFDGTPILDIKGYHSDYRVNDFTLPAWHLNLMNEAGHV
ncbi:MAG: tRNA (N6-threonylcarbamoyladenosine(37)-N6)-methyltransferase TrmO [Candidatus Binatia bacterium]